MTDQEINVALAKWAGWRHEAMPDYDAWYKPSGCYAGGATHDLAKSMGNAGVPTYTESLDAVHELEAKLSDDDQAVYEAYLYSVCRVNPNTIFAAETFKVVHATAKQRSLALVRALGLEETE